VDYGDYLSDDEANMGLGWEAEPEMEPLVRSKHNKFKILNQEVFHLASRFDTRACTHACTHACADIGCPVLFGGALITGFEQNADGTHRFGLVGAGC